MKTISTLGRIDWKDIKIGEIFAYKGCWSVFEKVTKTQAIFIDSDEDYGSRSSERGRIFKYLERGGFYSERLARLCRAMPYGCMAEWNYQFTNDNLYELPIAVQRLWGER